VSVFDIKYRIGSGAFSTVFLAERKKRVFALKQLNKEKLLLRNQMKYAITELRTLVKCRGCKYVIPLYFAFQTPENLYVALEYIPTGDLSTCTTIKAST
jgi:serine/threonine protein kinase